MTRVKAALAAPIVLLAAPAAWSVSIDLSGVATSPRTVLVNDLTVPEPPVDAAGTVSNADAGEVDATYSPQDAGVLWYLHQYLSETGVFRYEYGIAYPEKSQLSLELGHDVTADSTVAVFDGLAKDWAVARLEGKTTQTPPTPFGLTRFTEGSTSFKLTSPDKSTSLVGATVFYLYGSPGHRFVPQQAQDGGFNDLDGLEDGVITVAPPPSRRVDFVLGGDSLMGGLTGSPEAGLKLASAEGRLIRYTVPVVSRVIGVTGSTFISDLEVTNPFGLPVSGFLLFVPLGGDPATAPTVELQLLPGETLAVSDVLANLFALTGPQIGALHIGGFPLWNLSVVSRNYTPSAEGSYGISIPGIPSFDALTAETVWAIPGVKENERFRTNLFITGATDEQSVVDVYLLSQRQVRGSQRVEVAPYSLVELPGVVPTLGMATADEAYLLLVVEQGAVHAGISVADNDSDDASFILAQPVLHAQ